MPQQDCPELKYAPSTRFSIACARLASCAHVGRIAAAEFEAGADEAIRRRALHRVAAGDRAGERDEIDARVADHALRVRVAQVQRLERALGQAGLAQAFLEALGASGVWAECFSTTALPAISAGTTLLTAIRYG